MALMGLESARGLRAMNDTTDAPVVNETDGYEVVTSEVADFDESPDTDSGDDSKGQKQGDDTTDTQDKDDNADNGEGKDKADDKKRTDASEEADQPKGGRRFQKRIDRLTKRAAEAERRAEEAEAKLRSKGTAEKPADTAATEEEPDPADFDDYDDYLDKLADWKAGKKAAKAPEKPAEKKADKADDKPKDDKAAQSKPKVDQDFIDALEDVQESFDTFRADHEDFDDVITADDVMITTDMVKAMADVDNAAAIAYHLGKNKEEASRIAALSPIAQAREIGKLEVKLAAPSKPPRKKTTEAPDPIDPVKGSDSTAKDAKDMSFEEYEQSMNERERKGGGGFW